MFWTRSGLKVDTIWLLSIKWGKDNSAKGE